MQHSYNDIIAAFQVAEAGLIPVCCTYNCENCNNEVLVKYGSGRFCSCKCARGFSTKAKRKEINEIARIFSSKKRVEREIRICEKCNSAFECYINRNSKFCSNKCNHSSLSTETRLKISDANKGKTGGYRESGGKGKQGWYKHIFCNSSWELVYVIYCIDNAIDIKRNKIGYDYQFENKTFKYYPDFIVNDKFVEIKGYFDDKNIAKLSQFKYPIEIIDKTSIEKYFKYVIDKYGKDFLKMYKTAEFV